MNEHGEKVIVVGASGPWTDPEIRKLILRLIGDSRGVDGTLPVAGMMDEVPDRTEALESDDPKKIKAVALAMFENIKVGIHGILGVKPEKAQNGFVLGVSCNTFHAQPIWDEFLKLVEAYKKEVSIDIEIVNMSEETVKFALAAYPTASKVGVLLTKGSHKFGIYENLFKGAVSQDGKNIEMVVVDDIPNQHDTIYNSHDGLKAKPEPNFDDPKNDWALKRLKEHLDELIKKGAGAIILGCTELRFGLLKEFQKEGGGALAHYKGIPIIDSSAILAQQLVKKATRLDIDDVLGKEA